MIGGFEGAFIHMSLDVVTWGCVAKVLVTMEDRSTIRPPSDDSNRLIKPLLSSILIFVNLTVKLQFGGVFASCYFFIQ
ncbi:hypothetical protein L6452_13985 [Arctium lappa]|uniref:Uncharacterized protein n=1 Tax=Arctium lappa TaxID=4217 RepID=A0ACB9CJR1_ARCLA|nr:hypothetical protein L6452_13985 [Arctium lappa]